MPPGCADSYDPDRISVVSEYQCRPHGADYSMRGLANMRVDNILDPDTQRLIGIRTRMNFRKWNVPFGSMGAHIRTSSLPTHFKVSPQACGTATC
jgi:hypothetical protein